MIKVVWVVTFRFVSGYVVPIGVFTTKDKTIDFIIDFLKSVRDEYHIDMPISREYLLKKDYYNFSSPEGLFHSIRYWALALDPTSEQIMGGK